MHRNAIDYASTIAELLELERKNLQAELDASERNRWINLTKIVFGLSDELAEKRKFFRLQTVARAEIITPQRDDKAKVLSISGGGLFLETKQIPEVGSLIDVEIDVPSCHARQQRFRGKVRWISRGEQETTGVSHGVGIQFQDLDDLQSEAILDVLRDCLNRNLSILLEKYSFFCLHSPDITMLLDHKGSICEHNDQARRLFGFNSNPPCTINDLVSDSSGELLHEAISRAHLLKEPVRCEIAISPAGGEKRLSLDVLLVAVREQDLDLGVLFVGRDLSERVALEEQRRRLERRLYQADKLASLGRIVAGIGHDINNPLAWVLSNLIMLQEELPQISAAVRSQLGLELPAEFRFDQAALAEVNLHLGDIMQETLLGVYRIRDIIRDLKLFSRIDLHQEEELDVNEVLESSLRIVRNQIKQRTTLVCEYGPPLRTYLNCGKVSQVFLNLITNAIASFAAEDPQQNCLTVKSWAEEGQIKVSIADNGRGISPAEQQKIFDPFFTTNGDKGGTGLGLAIVMDSLQSLEGSIALQSEVDAGSCFIVSLPVRSRPAVIDSSFEHAASPGNYMPRLLAVDDEEVLLRVLNRHLRRRWQIVTVRSSDEALAQIAQGNPFDLILCDVMIPGKSGTSLYQSIKSRYPGLENRIVFMTGGAFSGEEKRSLESLPNVVVEKPFKISEIEDLLLEILDRLGPVQAPRGALSDARQTTPR